MNTQTKLGLYLESRRAELAEEARAMKQTINHFASLDNGGLPDMVTPPMMAGVDRINEQIAEIDEMLKWVMAQG